MSTSNNTPHLHSHLPPRHLRPLTLEEKYNRRSERIREFMESDDKPKWLHKDKHKIQEIEERKLKKEIEKITG